VTGPAPTNATAPGDPPSPVRRAALVLTRLAAGGAETVVLHLARTLKTLGVEPQVICLEAGGPLAEPLREAGVRLDILGSAKGYDFGAVFRLRRVLREHAPDAINVHDRASLPYVVAANLGRRTPIVFTGHGLLFNADSEPRRRYRLAMRGVRAATAVSEQVARRQGEVLAWRKGFTIIPNGVPDLPADWALRGELRAELGIGPDAFVFLSVGNARAEKGFEDLQSAAALLRPRAQGRPFVCLVAGKMDESDYCKALRQQQARLGLEDSVRFLGYRGDGHALRSAADALVLSSRSEGLPMVVLEAMMAGLPVVATRVGGVPDALGDAGLLAAANNPEELSAQMSRVMSEPQLARQLAAAARRKAVAAYSVRHMAEQYLRLFNQMASRRQGGGE